MQYRPIRAEEINQWREFQEYCFNVPSNEFQGYVENQVRLEHLRGVFDDEGRMLAVLTNLPFAMYVDGARIPMGGIAGVASLPEYRRGGNVGQLLVECIRETREQGMPLSGLYPFKQSFYRRYGWEVASAWNMTVIPMDQLAPYRAFGGVVTRHWRASEDWAELNAIYDRWARQRRGYMVRDTQAHWKEWVNAQWRPEDQQWHAAVWRPEAGAPPEGYVYYRVDKPDGKNRLAVKEMIALTPEAERGLWGFVAQHDSACDTVGIRMRRSYPIWHLAENAGGIDAKLTSGPMLRIVDVKGAFESRPWPTHVNGSVTIGFADEHAPWNHGTWQVSFEGGRAAVRSAPGATEDLAAAVQTWSQMYAGLVGPEQQARSQRLAVSNQHALRLLREALAGDEFFYYEYY